MSRSVIRYTASRSTSVCVAIGNCHSAPTPATLRCLRAELLPGRRGGESVTQRILRGNRWFENPLLRSGHASNRAHRTTRRTRPATASCTPSTIGGQRNDPTPAAIACNSTVRNAGTPDCPAAVCCCNSQSIPPVCRMQAGFFCVGERANRAGKRLLLRFDDARICAVPPQWTDAVAPDLESFCGRRPCAVSPHGLTRTRPLHGAPHVEKADGGPGVL